MHLIIYFELTHVSTAKAVNAKNIGTIENKVPDFPKTPNVCCKIGFEVIANSMRDKTASITPIVNLLLSSK